VNHKSGRFRLCRGATGDIQSPIRVPPLSIRKQIGFSMKRTWLLLVLLILAFPAAATDMYSWTDANGVKHFSDSPPPASATKAQRLKLKGGVTTGDDAANVQKEKEDAAKAAGPALAAAAGYAPEDIKRNCDIARKNQVNLEGQKLPVDAEVYPADLEAAKTRQAQMDKAAQQVKLFCAN